MLIWPHVGVISTLTGDIFSSVTAAVNAVSNATFWILTREG